MSNFGSESNSKPRGEDGEDDDDGESEKTLSLLMPGKKPHLEENVATAAGRFLPSPLILPHNVSPPFIPVLCISQEVHQLVFIAF